MAPLAMAVLVMACDDSQVSNVEAFKNGKSLVAISETIENGVMNRGVGMPGYPHLPEEERRAIAEYVASLRESD